MSADPRHHHYLPQCYLRGFTKGGGKKSKLKVFDLKRRRIFETATRNVCGVRDFNRVDVKGVDPYKLEHEWSDFEGDLATVLREMDSLVPLSGETRKHLLIMIAVMATRSPEMRENWRKFHAEIASRVMEIGLLTKERWELSARAAGLPLPPDGPSYEDMKEFYEAGQYKVEVPTSAHIFREMHSVKELLPMLNARKWVIYSSSDEALQFVTSDHSIVLEPVHTT